MWTRCMAVSVATSAAGDLAAPEFAKSATET
jgi:hypothetical protein